MQVADTTKRDNVLATARISYQKEERRETCKERKGEREFKGRGKKGKEKKGKK
jgi:hypothetical protein